MTRISSKVRQGHPRTGRAVSRRTGGDPLVATMRDALQAFADEPPAVLANWIAQVADPTRPSVVLLLGDPDVPLNSLRKAKDLFKLMRVLGREAPLRRLGHRLYAASIAAALVHHSARISNQSDRALSRALHFLLKDDEVPEVIRHMVQTASHRLPRVVASSIHFDPAARSALHGAPDTTGLAREGEDFQVPTLARPSRRQSARDHARSEIAIPEPMPLANTIEPQSLPARCRHAREPRYGRHFSSSRAFCRYCGDVVEIRRRIPNRPAHLWASILTAGLWFVPWGLFETLLSVTRWRCVDCHRGLSSATMT